MTKWALILVICSFESNTCIPPLEYPTQFNDVYDCMMTGYQESINKTIEIGREDINKHNIYIKFSCNPIQTI